MSNNVISMEEAKRARFLDTGPPLQNGTGIYYFDINGKKSKYISLPTQVVLYTIPYKRDNRFVVVEWEVGSLGYYDLTKKEWIVPSSLKDCLVPVLNSEKNLITYGLHLFNVRVPFNDVIKAGLRELGEDTSNAVYFQVSTDRCIPAYYDRI